MVITECITFTRIELKTHYEVESAPNKVMYKNEAMQHLEDDFDIVSESSSFLYNASLSLFFSLKLI